MSLLPSEANGEEEFNEVLGCQTCRHRERSFRFPDAQSYAASIGSAYPAGTVSSRSRGTVNRKTAPRGSFAPAHICPPCASMIERQMAKPMPMPWTLVV